MFRTSALLYLMLTSCTLNLQNIDTHGYTEDLVDEQLTNKPSTAIELPKTLNPTL